MSTIRTTWRVSFDKELEVVEMEDFRKRHPGWHRYESGSTIIFCSEEVNNYNGEQMPPTPFYYESDDDLK